MADSYSANDSPPRLIEPLLSKQGRVVTILADILLNCLPGDRLLAVQEYAERLEVSVGTVQAALDYLQTESLAQFEARGRLGTFVRVLHYPPLWSLAKGRSVIGMMPLPYSRRLSGLATGIRLAFGRQPVELSLRFMRGAEMRLQALAAGQIDWALVSSFAAQHAHAHGFDVEALFALGPSTYMAGHVLLLANDSGAIRNGMRVGMDSQSNDHTYLIRAMSRGKQVTFVEIEYEQGLKLLRSGAIDATVWSQEDLPAAFDGLTALPLDPQIEPALIHLSEAAIVVNHGNKAVANVLQATLNGAELAQVQQDVLHQVRLPSY